MSPTQLVLGSVIRKTILFHLKLLNLYGLHTKVNYGGWGRHCVKTWWNEAHTAAGEIESI